MSLTVFIDLSKYTEAYADVMLDLVTLSIESKAVKKVRVGDTGNLKNSIQRKEISPYKWIVFSKTDYAAAQEWGLGKFGKPNYGFTPYMRPAVKETEAIIKQLSDKAQKIAKRKATVNKRI